MIEAKKKKCTNTKKMFFIPFKFFYFLFLFVFIGFIEIKYDDGEWGGIPGCSLHDSIHQCITIKSDDRSKKKKMYKHTRNVFHAVQVVLCLQPDCQQYSMLFVNYISGSFN